MTYYINYVTVSRDQSLNVVLFGLKISLAIGIAAAIVITGKRARKKLLNGCRPRCQYFYGNLNFFGFGF